MARLTEFHRQQRCPLISTPSAPRHPLLAPVHGPAYKRATREPPRAHAAPPPAIVAATASTSVHPLSPPGKRLGTFPRTHGSFHCHLFVRIRPPLAGTRAVAEAPPLPTGSLPDPTVAAHRSLLSPIALPCRLRTSSGRRSPPASPPRRRRALL
jgi:hypothetical protein